MDWLYLICMIPLTSIMVVNLIFMIKDSKSEKKKNEGEYLKKYRKKCSDKFVKKKVKEYIKQIKKHYTENEISTEIYNYPRFPSIAKQVLEWLDSTGIEYRIAGNDLFSRIIFKEDENNA